MSDIAKQALVLVRCPTRVGGHDWSDEPEIGPSYCFACGMQKRDHDALASLLSEYEAQVKRIEQMEESAEALVRISERHTEAKSLPDVAFLKSAILAWAEGLLGLERTRRAIQPLAADKQEES